MAMPELYNRYRGGLIPNFKPRQTDESRKIIIDNDMIQVDDVFDPAKRLYLYSHEIKLIFAFLHTIRVEEVDGGVTLISHYWYRTGAPLKDASKSSDLWLRVPLGEMVSYALWGKRDTKLPFEELFMNIKQLGAECGISESYGTIGHDLRLGRIAEDSKSGYSAWAEEVIDVCNVWKEGGMPLRLDSVNGNHGVDHKRPSTRRFKDWELGKEEYSVSFYFKQSANFEADFHLGFRLPKVQGSIQSLELGIDRT